ncbi:MAG: energy transducer TonB [Ferruginibacter sp.]|nr:energy transducer TonB [Ferruginibacter sp.]
MQAQSFIKKLLFAFLTSFCLLHICIGQTYTHIYYFDKDLAVTKERDAIVIGKGFKEEGLYRLDYFGRQEGELFLFAHFIDSSLKLLQGPSTRFHKNGRVENQGNFLNDQKDGLWQSWDNKGLKKDSAIYQHGKAIRVAVFKYNKNGMVNYYSLKDSLADTFTTISYNDKGILTSEVFFKGQLGILKTYDSGTVKLDSLYTREEREAAFVGGQAAWIRYLQKNLNANTPVNNRSPRGKFQVMVKFIVAKDGSISEVIPQTKFGYGMEDEVVRIIKNGPKWEPAVQYGRKVNAYRRQPVTFIVEPY